MRRPTGTRTMGPVLAALLAGTLMVGTGGAASADQGPYGPFRDDNGSVHELDIIALWAAGITEGCDAEGHRFCPEEPVTRGQMAAFLRRAMDLPPAEETQFSDVDGSIFATDIHALAAVGVTSGCDADRYCPDRPITRGEMAALLARALGLPDASGSPFTDVSGSAFRQEIAAVAEAGITVGCDADRYCPDDPVTRAQMASFLVRAFRIPPVDPPPCPEEVCGLGALVPDDPSHGEDWRPLVEAIFPAGEVDRAVRVLHCESKGDPEARNPSSGASGLFQHLPRYWEERSTRAGYEGASIWDPIANVGVAAWLAASDGWHHWRQCL